MARAVQYATRKQPPAPPLPRRQVRRCSAMPPSEKECYSIVGFHHPPVRLAFPP
ncbi:hypothetical protein BO71DRAFT_395892, partial [Aspergillus ellipticus CBS 707.79]